MNVYHAPAHVTVVSSMVSDWVLAFLAALRGICCIVWQARIIIEAKVFSVLEYLHSR